MMFNLLVSNVDDHLRNHGFLWSGPAGWVLSPAFDLNPTPATVKARVLSTSIGLNDGACCLDLALDQAAWFGLSAASARRIASETGQAVATWRSVAAEACATQRSIDWMSSAFEHRDLEAALRT